MESNAIDHAALEASWPKWLAMVGQWLVGVYSSHWPSLYVTQSKFPQDLKKDPFVLG